MKSVEDYFESKRKAKIDKAVFIGFVVMIVVATLIYLLK